MSSTSINFYIIERHRPVKTSLETFSGVVLKETLVESQVIDSLDHYQSLYPESVILDSVMFPEDPVSGFTEEMRTGLFNDANQCSLQGKRMICVFSWDKVLSLLRGYSKTEMNTDSLYFTMGGKQRYHRLKSMFMELLTRSIPLFIINTSKVDDAVFIKQVRHVIPYFTSHHLIKNASILPFMESYLYERFFTENVFEYTTPFQEAFDSRETRMEISQWESPIEIELWIEFMMDHSISLPTMYHLIQFQKTDFLDKRGGYGSGMIYLYNEHETREFTKSQFDTLLQIIQKSSLTIGFLHNLLLLIRVHISYSSVL
jgi:hypothetical protein